MIVAVVNNKGGVGKTTTAIHIAKYLASFGGGVELVDGDLNESSLTWASQGPGLGFPVVGVEASKGDAPNTVIDAAARPTAAELADLGKLTDLVIVPTIADALSLDVTFKLLAGAPFGRYVVLLTMGEPQGTDAEEARAALVEAGHPVAEGRIRRFAAYRKAQLSGVTVDQLKGDKNAKSAWADYLAVGKELFHV